MKPAFRYRLVSLDGTTADPPEYESDTDSWTVGDEIVADGNQVYRIVEVHIGHKFERDGGHNAACVVERVV